MGAECPAIFRGIAAAKVRAPHRGKPRPAARRVPCHVSEHAISDRGGDAAMRSAALISLLLCAAAHALQLQPLAPSPRPVACRARVEPRMKLPSFKDAAGLSNDEIEKEIFNAKKELFEMRKKVKSR